MPEYDIELEGFDYIIGTGYVAQLSDKPSKKKKNPIGFSQPKENGGTSKKHLGTPARSGRPPGVEGTPGRKKV